MVRFTWLKSSYDTRGSHSTITGSEASPRLTSIQNTDSQPDIYQRTHNIPGGLDANLGSRTNGLCCFQGCPGTAWREGKQRNSRKEFLARYLDSRPEQHPQSVLYQEKRTLGSQLLCRSEKNSLPWASFVRCDWNSCRGCQPQKGPVLIYV